MSAVNSQNIDVPNNSNNSNTTNTTNTNTNNQGGNVSNNVMDKPLEEWSTQDVVGWLKESGSFFESLIPLFVNMSIAGSDLENLSDDQWRNLGVVNDLTRARLFNRIELLKKHMNSKKVNSPPLQESLQSVPVSNNSRNEGKVK